MTWHTSPLLITAAIAIGIVVAWGLVLTGSPTGQSFGISAFNAPAPRTGNPARGFDFGPYAEPFDTRRFLDVQRMCSPEAYPHFKEFPPDQHECCRRMCNDACNAYNDARPGTCLTPCYRGCSRGLYYDLP